VTDFAARASDFPFNISSALPSQSCQKIGMSTGIDRSTFDRLVLEHMDSSHRFAIRLCGNVTDAEDVMQEALLRAHRGWMTFRGESKFRTWFFQIVLNCFRDFIAATLRVADVSDEEVSDSTDPADEAQASELGEIIALEVSKLPPRQREVLVLSAYEQMSNGEIAAMLALNEQNVRTTLHLARERLKERLSKYIGQKT
jgi:RNA polymerase sigma-70 factor (ECF subfamily)